jgi:hypothetical protein
VLERDRENAIERDRDKDRDSDRDRESHTMTCMSHVSYSDMHECVSSRYISTHVACHLPTYSDMHESCLI